MKTRNRDLYAPEELFTEIVEGAVRGKIPVENAADLIGDAVASMTAHRLDEIGLSREFDGCVIAIKHVVVGFAAAKLVELKRIAELAAMARYDDPGV